MYTEIKDIDYCRGAFTATIWFDGRLVGNVWNHGRGDNGYAIVDSLGWAEMQLFLDQDIDSYVTQYLEYWRKGEDLRNMLSHRIVYRRNGEMLRSKAFPQPESMDIWIEHISCLEGVDMILNLMPFDEAFEAYANL